MKHPTEEKVKREIRIMRLDEALEIMLFTQKYYGEYENCESNYLYLDTAQLVRRIDLTQLIPESTQHYYRPEIVGDFFAVRKLSKELLEVSKISCHNLGMFYDPLEVLFNHKGFLQGWGKLKSALEFRGEYHLKEPKQVKLIHEGTIISKEDANYFIDAASKEAYVKNREAGRTKLESEDISVDLPISRNWTLGSFSLLPKNTWAAQISEAKLEQQIVSEYSGEPLEIALLREYTGVADMGNGVLTMSKSKLPLYLRRKLELSK